MKDIFHILQPVSVSQQAKEVHGPATALISLSIMSQLRLEWGEAEGNIGGAQRHS